MQASMLRPGSMLQLRRERDNDYDRRAIAVLTTAGDKLGYLPRIDNGALATLIDSGFAVTACVIDILPDPRQPDIRLDVVLAA
jgi:hypothetical protein